MLSKVANITIEKPVINTRSMKIWLSFFYYQNEKVFHCLDLLFSFQICNVFHCSFVHCSICQIHWTTFQTVKLSGYASNTGKETIIYIFYNPRPELRLFLQKVNKHKTRLIIQSSKDRTLAIYMI